MTSFILKGSKSRGGGPGHSKVLVAKDTSVCLLTNPSDSASGSKNQRT